MAALTQLKPMALVARLKCLPEYSEHWPAQGAVHLWAAYVQQASSPALLERYSALLSVPEVHRAGRFAFDRQRKRYLVTRALVRTVLSHYCCTVAPQEWVFEANEYGWPYVVNMQVVPAFNLTHTDDVVVLAIQSQGALGVDIEAASRHLNLELAERFFCAREVAALYALPERNRAEHLLSLWTLKESYIKARRMGLSIALNQVEFDLSRSGEIKFVCHEAQVHAQVESPAQRPAWQFIQLQLQCGHVLAVCSQRWGQDSRVAPDSLQCVLRKVTPLFGEPVLLSGWRIRACS
jgi:4'-phosphopantetheinyl transferase